MNKKIYIFIPILILVVVYFTVSSDDKNVIKANDLQTINASTTTDQTILENCQSYINGTPEFTNKELIDYSIYRITNVGNDYKSGTFLAGGNNDIPLKNTEVSPDDLVVIIGDTQNTSTGEHRFVILLVDEKTKEVKGYQPTK